MKKYIIKNLIEIIKIKMTFLNQKTYKEKIDFKSQIEKKREI